MELLKIIKQYVWNSIIKNGILPLANLKYFNILN